MPRRKKSPPYYKKRPNENLFRYLKRLIKSIIGMYPYARIHGMRYYFDTEFRRHISNKRKSLTRIKREGTLRRPGVKRQIKFKLGDRDGHKCNYCKAPFALDDLTIDHIVSLFRNGTNNLDNLQLLCVPCHTIKSKTEQKEDHLTSNLR